MNTEKMFEVAVRTKMRFPYKGLISVEDMWELSVRQLDSVFKTLNAELKQVKEESLLTTRTEKDEVFSMQIGIIKYIVEIKQEETKNRKEAVDKRAKKQKLMGYLAEKQDEDIRNKSTAEIQKMVDEL